MNLKGRIEIWVLDKKGKIKEYINKTNTILNSGKEAFFKNNLYKISKIGIGIDNTTPDSSQTGLLDEVRCEEANVSISGDYDIIVEHTFTDWTTPTDICEAGVRLYMDGNKEYLNRVTFDPVTCDEDNNIKIRFTITITD